MINYKKLFILLTLLCSFLFVGCKQENFVVVGPDTVILNSTIQLNIDKDIEVTWLSEQNQIASVTTSGEVNGHKIGITYIVASYKDQIYKHKIEVISATSILVQEKEVAIENIKSYVDLENYSLINQSAINSYLEEYKLRIFNCLTIEEINQISKDYKDKVDQILTIIQEKDKFELLKIQKIISLRSSFDLGIYNDIEKSAVKNILLEGEIFLNNALDEKQLNELYQVQINKIRVVQSSVNQYNKDSLNDFYSNETQKNNPYNDNIYQIFVRSFADSNNDGIGDLQGVIDKLDYIKDMGFTAIWLMPINDCGTYHGYDIDNYYSINKDYGTLSDLIQLVKQANDKGIKIYMDMVFNHTSNNNIWFKLALDGKEKYKNYYIFTDKNGDFGPGWHSSNQWKYYGSFSNTMPDLRLENPEVVEEIINIAKFYINIGIKGFRLDAVNHYFDALEYSPEGKDYSDNFLGNVRFLQRKLINKIKEYDDSIFIFGEIFEQNNYEYISDFYYGLDAPIDFPIQKIILDTGASASQSSYVTRIMKIYSQYSKANNEFISLPFLTNHDMDRVASYYNGNQDMCRLGAELLLTLPGSPIVYYGEEMGMYGEKTPGINNVWDETRRLPIDFGDESNTSWTKGYDFELINELKEKNKKLGTVNSQLEKKDSLINTYKTLLNLRNNNPALKYGNKIIKWNLCNPRMQGYIRQFTIGDDSYESLIIHNIGNYEESFTPLISEVIYSSNNYLNNGVQEISSIRPKSTIILNIKGE